MKRLDTISSEVLRSLHYEEGSYAVMAGDFLNEYRLRHLVDGVMPKLTTIRGQVAFNGELEAILLNPLFLLATEILNGTSVPGRISSYFLNQARRYALVAEMTNLAAFRTTQFAAADMFITSSHLASFFDGTAAPDPKSIKGPHSQAELLMSFLLGYEQDKKGLIDDEWVKNFMDSSPKSVVDPTKIQDAFSAVQSLLFTYAGKGRGQAISRTTYLDHLNACFTIESAIKACLYPELIATSIPSTSNLRSDGYALAMAYLVYLSHSSSPERYDAIFPPSARSAAAMTANVLMANSARRSAWFYAGMSSASAIFDLVAMIHFIKNTIQFLNPILDTEISTYKNMMIDLNAAEAVLKDNTVSPVQHHCNEILRRTTSVAGVDNLLPYFASNMFGLKAPVFRKEPLIPPGYPGIEKDFIVSTPLTSSDIVTIFPQLCDIVGHIRRVSEEISYTMSSFHLSSEYDPNSFNIESDLFSVHDDPTPATEIKYSSPIVADIFPMSIPRYSVEDLSYPERNRYWIFDKFKYAVINVIAMRAMKRSVRPRYVFDRKLSLPMQHSLASNFAQIPIPLNYTAETFFPSVGNTIPDVLSVLKSNPAMTTPNSYFEDAASAMIASDRIKRALTRVLSGMCRVFIVTANDDGTFPDWQEYKDGIFTRLLPPELPFIYGMPAKAFFAAQMEPKKVIKDFPDRVKIVDLTGQAQVVFILHDIVPAPQPYFCVNATLEDGFIASIPCGLTWYKELKKIMFASSSFVTAHGLENFSEHAPGPGKKIDKPVADLKTVTDALEEVPFSMIKSVPNYLDLLWTVTGWAHLTQYLPHLFFSVENPKWDEDLLLYGMDEMNHVRYRRRLITGSRSLIIQSAVEDYIVAIEPKDLIQMSEDEDKHPGPSEIVNIGPEQSQRQQPATPPKDPKVETVGATAPERTQVTETEISNPEARNVVTEAILRGEGEDKLIVPDDPIPGNEEGKKAPSSGTLGGDPKEKFKKK